MGQGIETRESLIARLKKQHGKLTQITTKDENGNDVVFIFKKPDMATMSATAKIAQTDPMQSALVFARNTLVDGDSALLEDVDIFSSISESIMSLVETRKVEVKNL